MSPRAPGSLPDHDSLRTLQLHLALLVEPDEEQFALGVISPGRHLLCAKTGGVRFIRRAQNGLHLVHVHSPQDPLEIPLHPLLQTCPIAAKCPIVTKLREIISYPATITTGSGSPGHLGLDSSLFASCWGTEKKGLLEPPHYFNLILGNIACAQANLLHSGIMINDLLSYSLWALEGIGNYQLSMNSVAIAMGGGVRVGLEDNIWYDPDRNRLARNSDLIRRIHTLAPLMKGKL